MKDEEEGLAIARALVQKYTHVTMFQVQNDREELIQASQMYAAVLTSNNDANIRFEQAQVCVRLGRYAQAFDICSSISVENYTPLIQARLSLKKPVTKPEAPNLFFQSLHLTGALLFHQERYADSLDIFRLLSQYAEKVCWKPRMLPSASVLYPTLIGRIQDKLDSKTEVVTPPPIIRPEVNHLTLGTECLERYQDVILAHELYSAELSSMVILNNDNPQHPRLTKVQWCHWIQLLLILSSQESQYYGQVAQALTQALSMYPYHATLRESYQKMLPEHYQRLYAFQDAAVKKIQRWTRDQVQRAWTRAVQDLAQERLGRQIAAEKLCRWWRITRDKRRRMNDRGSIQSPEIQCVSADRQGDSSQPGLNIKSNMQSNIKSKIKKSKNGALEETRTQMDALDLVEEAKDITPIPSSPLVRSSSSPVPISEKDRSSSRERALKASEAFEQELEEKDECLPQVSQLTAADPDPHSDTEKKEKKQLRPEQFITKRHLIISPEQVPKASEQKWRQIQPLWLDQIHIGLDIVNNQRGKMIIPWRTRLLQTLDEALKVYHHTAGEGEIFTRCTSSASSSGSSSSSSNRQCKTLLLQAIQNIPTWSLLESRQHLQKLIALAGLEPAVHSSRRQFYHDLVATCDSYFDGLQTDPAPGPSNVPEQSSENANRLKKSPRKIRPPPLQVELKLGLKPTESLDPDLMFRLRILRRQTSTRDSEEALRAKFHRLLVDCSTLGALREAYAVVKGMKSTGLQPTRFVYQTLICTCKHRKPEAASADAVKIFQLMKRKAMQPNRSILHLLLSTCGQSGHWRRAVQVFRECTSAPISIVPNTSLFEALAQACSRSSRDEAPQVYDALKFAGVPEVLAYATAMRSIHDSSSL